MNKKIEQMSDIQIIEEIKSIKWEDGKVSQNFNPLTMMKDDCERQHNLKSLEQELLSRLSKNSVDEYKKKLIEEVKKMYSYEVDYFKKHRVSIEKQKVLDLIDNLK